MANSEEKEMMAGFEIVVTSKTQSQAVFIEAVVMPEIAAVLAMLSLFRKLMWYYSVMLATLKS